MEQNYVTVTLYDKDMRKTVKPKTGYMYQCNITSTQMQLNVTNCHIFMLRFVRRSLKAHYICFIVQKHGVIKVKNIILCNRQI